MISSPRHTGEPKALSSSQDGPIEIGRQGKSTQITLEYMSATESGKAGDQWYSKHTIGTETASVIEPTGVDKQSTLEGYVAAVVITTDGREDPDAGNPGLAQEGSGKMSSAREVWSGMGRQGEHKLRTSLPPTEPGRYEQQDYSVVVIMASDGREDPDAGNPSTVRKGSIVREGSVKVPGVEVRGIKEDEWTEGSKLVERTSDDCAPNVTNGTIKREQWTQPELLGCAESGNPRQTSINTVARVMEVTEEMPYSTPEAKELEKTGSDEEYMEHVCDDEEKGSEEFDAAAINCPNWLDPQLNHHQVSDAGKLQESSETYQIGQYRQQTNEVTEQQESSETHQIGQYVEQTREVTQVTNTTNVHGETSSSTQVQTTKWSSREGREYKTIKAKQFTIKTSSTTFKPRAVYYEEQRGETTATRMKAIEHWIGYKQMVELCRIIPDEGTELDPGQLPFREGLVDNDGDLLYGTRDKGIPKEVLAEIQRFHSFCETAQPEMDWKSSNDRFVATYASALITTPMYMRAVYQGRYFDIMVDLGAAVSLFANIGQFPGAQYEADVAPIAIVSVSGDSMICQGLIDVPVRLTADSFTGTETDSKAFTVQSGFAGRCLIERTRSLCAETGTELLMGLNSDRTHIEIKFRGYHFPTAGPQTPILGMDYFVQQQSSSQYSVPKGVDFSNGCLVFDTPKRDEAHHLGRATVRVFSTVGVGPSIDHGVASVLVVVREDICIPPGGTANARCIGQCGPLGPGTCIISPHPRLLSLTPDHERDRMLVKGDGTEQFILSYWVPDVNLLIDQNKENLEYSTDHRLQRVSHGLMDKHGQPKAIGLIATFQIEELNNYTAIDGVSRGESHKDFHISVLNNSSVELILLAGQPIAEASPVLFQDVENGIRSRARTEDGQRDKMTQRQLQASNEALTHATMIVSTLCREAGPDKDKKNKMNALYYKGTGHHEKLPVWVEEECMALTTTSNSRSRYSPYSISDVVATINVQRELMIESLRCLMEIEHSDKGIGLYRFSMTLKHLMVYYPTLLVPVLADLMMQEDQDKLFRQTVEKCKNTDPDKLIVLAGKVLGETLLMIENWTEDRRRAIRGSPFPNGHDALKGLSEYWTNSEGATLYTSKVQERLTQEEAKRDMILTFWDRLSNALYEVQALHKGTGAPKMVNCNQQTDQERGRRSKIQLAVNDPELHEQITMNQPHVIAAHYACTVMDERYAEFMNKGLSKVRQAVDGRDELVEGEDVDRDLDEFYRCQKKRVRDIDEEAETSEKAHSVGGDPEDAMSGYHFNLPKTTEEIKSERQEVFDKFANSEGYHHVSRMVETTDTDEGGNRIWKPWWKWTVIQKWRELRHMEPEEQLHGEDDENDVYTIRSVLQVGIPNDKELEEMGLTTDDRITIIESVWSMAPGFYQGPVLPEIRHFTFTKMFMSLVTEVPYRQRPLVIPVASEEMVYSSIRAMIKEGVVEASLSPYNNGLLLVAKKAARPGAPSPGMRVVLDARGLNHITRRVTWPIEDLGLCLREVAGAAFITVTDVLSGFHLIPLDQECRPPTAFTCGSLGHLQYCRAGMGMANSPARFASALSGVLGGQRHNACGNGASREGNGCAPGPSVEDLETKSSRHIAAGVDVQVTEERQRKYTDDCDKFRKQVEEGEYDILMKDVFSIHRCLCIVYVDDVTIATWYDRSQKVDSRMEGVQLQAHIRDVKAVIRRMRLFGIICKAVKSEIAKPRSDLLGYVVGRDGLRVNANKIDKLTDIDLPHSKEGLNFFIGLTGFYRQFVPRLAELEAPLRTLLNRSDLPEKAPKRNPNETSKPVGPIPSCWHETVPKSGVSSVGALDYTYMDLYEQILKELAKFTALSSIDYRPRAGRVGVASDASKVGLAAVLFQETPWGTTKSGETLWVERPIAFYSKVLVARHQGRAAYDRELAALTLAVRQWSKYLLGRPVMFIADHQPLGFMLEPKGTSAADKRQSTRLIHFILELSRYNAVAEWRRGTNIPVVDCISRLLKVVETIFLTTKAFKDVSEPTRYAQECDKLSLIRSQPYTHKESDKLAQNLEHNEEGWKPVEDLEPAIQNIIANTELWGIAKDQLIDGIRKSWVDLDTKDSKEFLLLKDADLYMAIVKKTKEALAEAQQCRERGRGHCSQDEWDRYAKLAEAIGIKDYEKVAPTLTPYRHISSGGTLRDDIMTGPAWVQIDTGVEWKLKEEPAMVQNDTQEVMTNVRKEGDTIRANHKCLEDLEYAYPTRRNFEVFKVQITVDTKPMNEMSGTELALCQCWTDSEYNDEGTSQINSNSMLLEMEENLLTKDDTGWTHPDELHQELVQSGNWRTQQSKVYKVNSVSIQPEVKEDGQKMESVFTVALNELMAMPNQMNEDIEEVYNHELRQINALIAMPNLRNEEIKEVYNHESRQIMDQNSELGPLREVNFTKAANPLIKQGWTLEADQCKAKCNAEKREQIRIAWHNVNGLKGFITALTREPNDYFIHPELYPDVFGILEAQVSEEDPELESRLGTIRDLLQKITGEPYHTIRSLRMQKGRCGMVVFLKITFLESRRWWTWMGDSNVAFEGETWEEAGYEWNSDRVALGKFNEWQRDKRLDEDGRTIQLIFGPKRTTNLQEGRIVASLKVILVYVRNSTSGKGDLTARLHFNQKLHDMAMTPPWIPTFVAGDMNSIPYKEGIVNPAGYVCNDQQIYGRLDHEVRGHEELIKAGYTTNELIDGLTGDRTVHNAGGMGAHNGRCHVFQLFGLNRMYLNDKAKALYLTTAYRSVSILGQVQTRKILERVHSQKSYKELVHGSDHSLQVVVICEPDDVVTPSTQMVPESAITLNPPRTPRLVYERTAVGFKVVCASKVWLIRNNQILSYYRSDSGRKPQFDTFGGQMEAKDTGSPVTCLLREVREEVRLPHQWLQQIVQVTQECPTGHYQLEMIQKSRMTIHKVAMWIVKLPDTKGIDEELVIHPSGLREMIPQSLGWRPFREVTSNIMNVYSFRAVAEALNQWERGECGIQGVHSVETAGDVKEKTTPILQLVLPLIQEHRRYCGYTGPTDERLQHHFDRLDAVERGEIPNYTPLADFSTDHTSKVMEMWKVVVLISAWDLLQEASYAMTFPFRSNEACITWAGLGHGSRNRYWVTRLTIARRWEAVSNLWSMKREQPNIVFATALKEVSRLYESHRRGYLETKCVRSRQKDRRTQQGINMWPTATKECKEKAEAFATLKVMNSREEPNQNNIAWHLGSGSEIRFEGQRTTSWIKTVNNTSRPGVKPAAEDYGISERASQNDRRQRDKWSGRWVSLDAGRGPVTPRIGLLRQAGQNGGRSGAEYSTQLRHQTQVDDILPDLWSYWKRESDTSQMKDHRQRPMSTLSEIANRVALDVEVQGATVKVVESCRLIKSGMDQLVARHMYLTHHRSGLNSVYGHQIRDRLQADQDPSKMKAKIRRGLLAVVPLYVQMQNLLISCGQHEIRRLQGLQDKEGPEANVHPEGKLESKQLLADAKWIVMIYQIRTRWLTWMEEEIVEITDPRDTFNGELGVQESEVWMAKHGGKPEDKLEGLAIRRREIRLLVDQAWERCNATVRRTYEEKDQPVCHKVVGSVCRFWVPLVKSEAKRSHCWVAHWDNKPGVTVTEKFDATKYTGISTRWKDLMDVRPQPVIKRKGSLATQTGRPTNWINWASVMSRYYCCKSEWITRRTVQVQFSRGFNVSQATRMIETQFGQGARVRFWDGSDLTSHFIPIQSGPKSVIHYHVETGSKWSPWWERPANFYSMWGVERRPLISDPYALTIGDRSIKKKGSKWRRISELMGTVATRKYFDRWLPKQPDMVKSKAQSEEINITQKVDSTPIVVGVQPSIQDTDSDYSMEEDIDSMEERRVGTPEMLEAYWKQKGERMEAQGQHNTEKTNVVCSISELTHIGPWIFALEGPGVDFSWIKRVMPDVERVIPEIPEKVETYLACGVSRVEQATDSIYEVERIMEEKGRSTKRKYRIRWKGCEESQDTWELTRALTGCPKILDAWKKSNRRQVKVTKDKFRSTDKLEIVSNHPNPAAEHLPVFEDVPGKVDVCRQSRGSLSTATAQCAELSKVLWLIRNDWKTPSGGDHLEYKEIIRTYGGYRNELMELDGSVYKIRDGKEDGTPKVEGHRHLQWIVPRKMRWNILRTIHDTPNAGHPSYNVMLYKLRETMWWPKMTAHVRTLTDTCEACQRAKRGHDPVKPNSLLLRYRLPNSEITIDVVEGQVLAANGWRYIVCIVDSASRYVEFYGSKNNDAEAVTDALVHWICGGKGFPRTIRHSQDVSIVNAVVANLLRRLTIGSKTENAYAPQLIGVNERTHKELGNHIRIHTRSNPEMWHQMLPWAQYVHNTSIHRMTGCTPLYLELGNPRETMVEVAYLPEISSEIPVKDLALRHLHFYYQLSQQARHKDLQYHNESIKRQQKNLDSIAQAETYPIGTLVLVYLPWVTKGLNRNLADRWHGPFKIISNTPDSYNLQYSHHNQETGGLIKVARGRVRRYRTMTSEMMLPNSHLKRNDGVEDWIEPDLFQWKAMLEKETDVEDDEVIVSVAPQAVTALLFDVTKPTQEETEVQQVQRVQMQCNTLFARYHPEMERPHISVSTAYWTGDYGSTISMIREQPNIVEQLVRSLASPKVMTMETKIWVGSVEGSTDVETQLCSLLREKGLHVECDNDTEVGLETRIQRAKRRGHQWKLVINQRGSIEIDWKTVVTFGALDRVVNGKIIGDEEMTLEAALQFLINQPNTWEDRITDHYVLLPHEGQVRKRTMGDVLRGNKHYPCVIYNTVAGDNIIKLMKWTGLGYDCFRRAPLDMRHIEGIEPDWERISNRSLPLPVNTWIRVDSAEFRTEWHLKGTWHRYDPVSRDWDAVWGKPKEQAKETRTTRDDHQVRYALAQRSSRQTEKGPDQLRFVIRWKGEYEGDQKYDTVSQEDLHSESITRMLIDASIVYSGSYGVAKQIVEKPSSEYDVTDEVETKKITRKEWEEDRIYLTQLANRDNRESREDQEKWPQALIDDLQETTRQWKLWEKGKFSTAWKICNLDLVQKDREIETLPTMTIGIHPNLRKINTIQIQRWLPDNRTTSVLEEEQQMIVGLDEQRDLQMVNAFYTQSSLTESRAEEQNEQKLKRKQLLTTSTGWSKRVRGQDKSTAAEDKDQYMNCMRDLYKIELIENRKQNRITLQGTIKKPTIRRGGSGLDVEFEPDNDERIPPEFHGEKEVELRFENGHVRGKIVVVSGKSLIVTIKDLMESPIHMTIGQGGLLRGSIEPIDRSPLERQLESICNQKASSLIKPEVADYILYALTVRKDPATPPLINGRYDPNDKLNSIQRETVNWASNLVGLGLIAGPPGTGKTETAATLIHEWSNVPRKESQGPVLVVASSNAAVDVLLARVDKYRKNVEDTYSCKFGRLCSRTHGISFRKSRISEYDVAQIVMNAKREEQKGHVPEELNKEEDQVGDGEFGDIFNLMGASAETKRWYDKRIKEELRKCDVIFTTNTLAGAQYMSEIRPRKVLMDEAGATTEIETFLIAARNPDTMLLVGDFMQLPPVIKSREVRNIIEWSLMERLWRFTNVPRRQLLYQYRFDPKVEGYLNEFIYNKESCMQAISTDPHYEYQRQVNGLYDNLPLVIIDSSSTCHGRGENHVPQQGYDNSTEAQLVVDVIRRIAESVHMTSQVGPDSIGVCTPYRRQVQSISHKLHQMTKKVGFQYNKITVATADAFQGSEREYMIMSMVRTSSKNIDFALSQKRLNVMLTRGKLLTVVVVNRSMFEGDQIKEVMNGERIQPDLKRGAQAIRGLFTWAEKHHGIYNEHNWALMFQVNSNPVNTIKVMDNPECKRKKWIVSDMKEWAQLSWQGIYGNKEIIIVNGKWNDWWNKIPVDLIVELTDVNDQMATHDHPIVTVMKEIDRIGVSIIRICRPLGRGGTLKSMSLDDPEECEHTWFRVIIDRLEKSRSLHEVYITEAPEWDRLIEWIPTKYSIEVIYKVQVNTSTNEGRDVLFGSNMTPEWTQIDHPTEFQVNMNSLWTDTTKERIQEPIRQRFHQLLRAVKLDILRKRFFIKDNEEGTDSKLRSWSEREVERHWELMWIIFRVSKIRFLLMGQVKPYCYRLWTENIIGPQISRVNLRRETTSPLTMLSVQKVLAETKGYGHHTEERWPMLLMYVMLNQKPGSGRYCCLSRIPSVEEGTYEIDRNVMDDRLRETGYNQKMEEQANDCWMYISTRTKRIMHGMYMLESYTQRLAPVEDMNYRIKCINVSKLVQKVQFRMEQFPKSNWITMWDKLVKKIRSERNNRRWWKQLVYRKDRYETNAYKKRARTLLKRDLEWVKYTVGNPWARSVPLIISLTRGSLIKCAYKNVLNKKEEPQDNATIEQQNEAWLKWEAEEAAKLDVTRDEKAAKSDLEFMVTLKEVNEWWLELRIEHKAQYLVKAQYERIRHSWHCQEVTRRKWYLGKLPRGIQDYEMYTLFHSTKRRRIELDPTEQREGTWSPVNLGGGSIPDEIKRVKSAEMAGDLCRQHCDQFAYHPLGKKRGFEASMYKGGVYVTLDQVGSKGPYGNNNAEGAPIHPTHLMELSKLNEYSYTIKLYMRNSEPMTDKNIEKETFCKAGITTAMMEDQKVGPFTCGLATIMEGNRKSRDPTESKQWCDRCEYRERQFHTINTPQGIPVAKKLENAGKIHVNYKGPLLNFASCQRTELETHGSIVAALMVGAADVEVSAEREAKPEKLLDEAQKVDGEKGLIAVSRRQRWLANQAKDRRCNAGMVEASAERKAKTEQLVDKTQKVAAEAKEVETVVKKAAAAKEAKGAEEVEKERKLGWKQRRLIQRQAQVKERTVEDGSLEDQKAAADSFDEEMSRIAAEIESRK